MLEILYNSSRYGIIKAWKGVDFMEVYLDNSATTKPYAQVVEEMCKALTEDFANPSSAYRKGFLVEKKIKKIRQKKKKKSKEKIK